MEAKIDSKTASELLKANVDCLQPITELDEDTKQNLKSTTSSKNNRSCSQHNSDADDNSKGSIVNYSIPSPDNKFFFEDEVFRLDKKGNIQFGLIIESSGSHSGDEDDDYQDSLSKGDVRAIWYPEGQELILQESLIGLADRSLMPGDVVRRLLPERRSQRGYCREIQMKADVQILGSKYVIKNVNAERLKSINKWQRDNAVCLDSWVGCIKDIEEKAILRTIFGCRFEICSRDFLSFKDVKSSADRDVFNPQIFYPGNTLVGSVSSIENLKILTPDIPLHMNKRGKILPRKFIVESVYVESVWVYWQCKSLSSENDPNIVDAVQPPICVTGEDLKRLRPLDLFESCMLQINDRNYLAVSPSDTIVRKGEWQQDQNKKYMYTLLKQRPECYRISKNYLKRSISLCSKKPFDIAEEAHKNCIKLAKKFHSKSCDLVKFSDIQKAVFKKYLRISNGETEKYKEKEKEKESDDNDIKKDVDDNFNDNDKDKNNYKPKEISKDSDNDNNDNVKDEDEDDKVKNGDNIKHDDKDKSQDEEWITEDDTASVDDAMEMSSSSTPSKPHNLYKSLSKNKIYQKNFGIVKNKSPISPELSKKNSFEDRNSAENSTTSIQNLAEYTIKTKKAVSICSSLSLHSGNSKSSSYRQSKKKSQKFLSLKTITNKTEKLVTEALLIYSTATVVWQDGTVENDVPSTHLYPIHHLDTHEFFPGDFVVYGRSEGKINYREYGVIQTVDYVARIALVKWFTTYTSLDDPQPTFNGESEVSVYDLKDHPDFQYRPGTMVIRVANFDDDDDNGAYSIGQIIDNFTDGRVKVWWVDDRINMCWPQDLFEVGHYDNGEWGHDSDDSWETESENSEFGGTYNHNVELSMASTHTLVNIEKARAAISRLEETFNINPSLHNPEVMRKLLNVYKICRYTDRLLNTTFFHEDNFKGLIERVRKVGIQNIHERAQNQMKRLFNGGNSSKILNSNLNLNLNKGQPNQPIANTENTVILLNAKDSLGKIHTDIDTLEKFAGEESPPPLFNNSLQSTTSEDHHIESQTNESENVNVKPLNHSLKQSSFTAVSSDIQCEKLDNVPKTDADNSYSSITNEDHTKSSALQFTEQITLNNCYEENGKAGSLLPTSETDDNNSFKNHQFESDICILNGEGEIVNGETENDSAVDPTDAEDLGTPEIDDSSAIKAAGDLDESNYELRTVISEMVCERLCSLLKEQILKSVNFIRTKYFKAEDPLVLSDLFNNADLEDNIFGLFTEDITITMNTDKTPNADEKDTASDNNDEIPEKETSPTRSTTDELPNTDISNGPDNEPLADKSDLDTSESFIILPLAPRNHKYYHTTSNPNKPQHYHTTILKEYRLLKDCLPPGTWVRAFEDRMDLLSIMIEGPKKTPYEDGMFLFDIQLPNDYPRSPPLCHYISFCSDRLNPNLYEDGKVCVSLLGTWTGKDTEVWCAGSTLLQVIVSIQGLILVAEPYFNEAGYERQRGTQQGKENSRIYNEMVIIKLTQATSKLLQNPPETFREQIQQHFVERGLKMYERINGYMKYSEHFYSETAKSNEKLEAGKNEGNEQYGLFDFPLVPASRGFCISLKGFLETFKQKLMDLIDLSNSSKSLNIDTTTTT